MWVRDATPEDTATLADIFFRAVREGATAYSEAERIAWVAEPVPVDVWAERIEGLDTVVAEEDGALLGFMSLRAEDGYLDLAFVLPEWHGKGVAERLYCVLEGRARAAGSRRLTTHASRMARPFFARMGWQVVAREEREKNGQVLERFAMDKVLEPSTSASTAQAAGW